MNDIPAMARQTASPARLFNRNFALLWQGQLVSQVGTQAYAIAAAFWIQQATGSATLMGLMLMLSSLPAVVLGPIGGTLADRHSRRAIIVVCDALSGLAILALAGLFVWRPEATDLLLVGIFSASVVVGVLGAFFRPAISAAIPDLVPAQRLAAANSLNQGSAQVAMFVGQGVGGVLYRLLGAPLLFLFDGLSYLFSAASEFFIRIPQALPEAAPSWNALYAAFKRETVEGFSYVWQRRGMRNFFLAVAVLNFFSMPLIVLLPFYVTDVLQTTADWYGFLLAAHPGGALLGYAVAGALKLQGRVRGLAVIGALLAVSVVFSGVGLVTAPGLAVGLFGLAGVMSGFINISIITLLQQGTPSRIRGRVFGLLTTLSMGLAPLGLGASGVVADLLGRNVPLIYVSVGVISGALTLLIALDPAFRAFLGEEAATPAEDTV